MAEKKAWVGGGKKPSVRRGDLSSRDEGRKKKKKVDGGLGNQYLQPAITHQNHCVYYTTQLLLLKYSKYYACQHA